MKRILNFSLLISGIFFFSCGDSKNTSSKKDEPTEFFVEKNLQPYIETTLIAYSGYAPKEHFKPIFAREIDVVNAFMNDKSFLVLMSRDLDSSEKAYFKKLNFGIRTDKIILGAIALISKQGEDSTYTEAEFMKLLTTDDKNSPKIVFDDVQSSNFNYFYDRLKKEGKEFGSRVKCLHGNEEVIQYMKEHGDCIGVIGYNWISDVDSKAVQERMKGIQIIEVAKGNSKNFVLPTMYYVYEKQYPFTHFWYAHLHGDRNGMEAGLLNYIRNERGQLIAKKSGMQPYYRISREFKFIFE